MGNGQKEHINISRDQIRVLIYSLCPINKPIDLLTLDLQFTWTTGPG